MSIVCLLLGCASLVCFEDWFVDLKDGVGGVLVNRETKEEGWSLSKEIKRLPFFWSWC